MPHSETLPYVICQLLSWAMMVAWCLVGGMSLYYLARGVVREDRRWVLLLTGLFVTGALLRLSLATWGVGDDQFRYAHFHTSTFHISVPVCRLDLGSAPESLWRLLPIPAESGDTVIVVVTLLAGSLAPVLLALFVDLIGVGRVGAFGAGAVLCLHAVAIRWSGGMGRSALVLFLASLALWAFARAKPLESAASLVLFVLAAWLCARTRPEAGAILPVAGFCFLALRLDTDRPLRDIWSWDYAAALAVAGAVAVGHLAYVARFVPSYGSKLDVILGKSWLAAFSPERALWLDPGYTSVVVIALLALGLVFGLSRARRATIWAAGSLFLVVLMSPPEATASLVVNSRYQGLPLLLSCVIAGIGVRCAVHLVEARFGGAGRIGAVVVLAAAVPLTSVGPVERVCRPVTVDVEYHFLKEALRVLPEHAVIYSPFSPGEDISGGFREPQRIWRRAGREAWRRWPPDGAVAESVAYFYRSPLCHVSEDFVREHYPASVEILARCRAAMSRAGSRPVVVKEIPAVPWGAESYVGERIEIGFYEVAR